MREGALEVGRGPEHKALYIIEESLDFYLLCDGKPLKNLGERDDMLRFACWKGPIGSSVTIDWNGRG